MEPITPQPPITCTPIQWEVMPRWWYLYGRAVGSIHIELRRNREGVERYAVLYGNGSSLSKSGEWDDEPLPSSRTDEYLADHRWESFDDAKAAAQEAAQTLIDRVHKELDPDSRPGA